MDAILAWPSISGCSLPLLAAESYRIEARPILVAPVEAGRAGGKQELCSQPGGRWRLLPPLSDLQVQLDGGRQPLPPVSSPRRYCSPRARNRWAKSRIRIDPSYEERDPHLVSVVRKGKVIPGNWLIRKQRIRDPMSANIFWKILRSGYEYTVAVVGLAGRDRHGHPGIRNAGAGPPDLRPDGQGSSGRPGRSQRKPSTSTVPDSRCWYGTRATCRP